MGASYQLLVGLGNPGIRYAATRHNAGIWLLERVVQHYTSGLKSSARCCGAIADAEIDGTRTRLFRSDTFMNDSGRAVAAVAGYYRIPIERILIAHDEIDLPVGTVRLKRGGGHGGHNGLRDIVPKLAGSGFSRIRIGIGHPGSRDRVIGHVLERPTAAERNEIDASIGRVLDHLGRIIVGDLESVMNTLHWRAQAGDDPDAPPDAAVGTTRIAFPDH